MVRTVQDKSEQVRTSQNKSILAITGLVWTGVVKIGQDKPDQIKTGPDRLEQVKNPQNI